MRHVRRAQVHPRAVESQCLGLSFRVASAAARENEEHDRNETAEPHLLAARYQGYWARQSLTISDQIRSPTWSPPDCVGWRPSVVSPLTNTGRRSTQWQRGAVEAAHT